MRNNTVWDVQSTMRGASTVTFFKTHYKSYEAIKSKLEREGTVGKPYIFHDAHMSDVICDNCIVESWFSLSK